MRRRWFIFGLSVCALAVGGGSVIRLWVLHPGTDAIGHYTDGNVSLYIFTHPDTGSSTLWFRYWDQRSERIGSDVKIEVTGLLEHKSTRGCYELGYLQHGRHFADLRLIFRGKKAIIYNRGERSTLSKISASDLTNR